MFPDALSRLVEPPLFLARVESQERDAYAVFFHAADSGEHHVRARLSGALRHAARDAADLPVVGDYVAIDYAPGDSVAIVRGIVQRRNLFSRRAAGGTSALQAIAANLDTLVICVACNRDFNLRRLERYLSGAERCDVPAVIALTKTALASDVAAYRTAAESIASGRPVIATSALEGIGLAAFDAYRGPHRTLAFVGSSGAGKSTLLNALLGADLLATGAARYDDDRGRHTTTRRQLLLLDDGTAIVDTPGMREFGLTAGEEAVGSAFDDLAALAAACKFRDCRHQSEPGCAVLGSLDPERLASWRKLSREVRFEASKFDLTIRQAEQRRWKSLSKSSRASKKRRGG